MAKQNGVEEVFKGFAENEREPETESQNAKKMKVTRKFEETTEYIRNEVSEMQSDLEKNLAKFKDPVVQAAIMYEMVRERENTTKIVDEINAKLERLLALEERVRGIETKLEEISAPPARPPQGPYPDELMPEVDKNIRNFVKAQGKVCASDVQAAFGYKGKNAASARLNKLAVQGLLLKMQVGRKVYYMPK